MNRRAQTEHGEVTKVTSCGSFSDTILSARTNGTLYIFVCVSLEKRKRKHTHTHETSALLDRGAMHPRHNHVDDRLPPSPRMPRSPIQLKHTNMACSDGVWRIPIIIARRKRRFLSEGGVGDRVGLKQGGGDILTSVLALPRASCP